MSLKVSYKDWESDILGQNVYSFEFLKEYNSLDEMEKLNLYNASIPQSNKALLTTRISSQSHNTRWFLEAQQWNVIECYIELKNSLQQQFNIESEVIIREYHEDDLDVLKQIASKSFTEDRFHTDTQISKVHADNSRREWVENSCNGRAKVVFVAVSDDKPVGFLLVMEKVNNNTKYGVIDLIAVDENHRGKKIGESLVRTFVNYSIENGYQYTVVGTQAHNIASLGLYEKCGFIIHDTFYSMHKHLG